MGLLKFKRRKNTIVEDQNTLTNGNAPESKKRHIHKYSIGK